MNEYEIESPELLEEFTRKVWEPTEKEEAPEPPPILEYKLKPPVEFAPGGGLFSSRSVEWGRPANDRVRLNSLRERVAERRAPSQTRGAFQEAKLKGLAERRFERAAQDRQERGR